MSTDIAAAIGSASSPTAFPLEVTIFIERLTQLQRSELALFRRCAGRTIGEAGRMGGYFYRWLPPSVQQDEEIYFLIATLYPLNKYRHTGNLGTTLRDLRSRVRLETMDRRMMILLDSDFDQVNGHPGGGKIAHLLRQWVALAARHQVGIHWERLLTDLTWWSHPDKRVQKDWARSYFTNG